MGIKQNCVVLERNIDNGTLERWLIENGALKRLEIERMFLGLTERQFKDAFKAYNATSPESKDELLKELWNEGYITFLLQ